MQTDFRLWLEGEPIAQPRHQIAGRGRYYRKRADGSPHPITGWRQSLVLAAREILPPDAPWTGPMRLWLLCVHERPADHHRSRKRSNPVREAFRATRWKTSTPDVDNLVKATCDALNGEIWGDDAQIVHAEVAKVYTHAIPGFAEPGVLIRVERLKPHAALPWAWLREWAD